MISLLFVAGDLSGDVHLALLARRVLARHPAWRIFALGGPHLRESGAQMLGDSSGGSAIGFVPSLLAVPRGLQQQARVLAFLKKEKIDAAVLCDWGAFNGRLLQPLKRRGVPVLYYFPPRSWQREGTRGLSIAPFVTRVATPFLWSAQRLQNAGCDAEWVGHPLLESAPSFDESGEYSHSFQEKRNALRREFGASENENLIALFPGSRALELKLLAPTLSAAAKLLMNPRAAAASTRENVARENATRENAGNVSANAAESSRTNREDCAQSAASTRDVQSAELDVQTLPNSDFPARETLARAETFPSSNASTRDALRSSTHPSSFILHPSKMRRFVVAAAAGRGAATQKFFADAAFADVLKVVENRGDEVLAACDAAIVKSGTSTLQAAVMGAPQVVVYDVPPLLRAQAKRLGVGTARVPFVAMPNILLGREIVRELLGEKCTAQNIAAEIETLLQPEIAVQMRREYSQVREELGASLPIGATERTAQMLEEMLQQRT